MREEVLMVSSSRHANGRHRSTLTSTGSPEQVREHGQTEDDIQFDTDTMAFVETPLSVNGLFFACTVYIVRCCSHICKANSSPV